MKTEASDQTVWKCRPVLGVFEGLCKKAHFLRKPLFCLQNTAMHSTMAIELSYSDPIIVINESESEIIVLKIMK